MTDVQDREVRAMLGRLTSEQLREGLQKGRDMLASLDAIEAMEDGDIADTIGHPGRHASKHYEAWAVADMDFRRRQLCSAINDTQAELERRSHPMTDLEGEM